MNVASAMTALSPSNVTGAFTKRETEYLKTDVEYQFVVGVIGMSTVAHQLGSAAER